MAIITSHAALIFRRFLGPKPSLTREFPVALLAPVLPASASNAASGSAALRNNSSGVNLCGSVMDSRSLSRLQLLARPDSINRFCWTPAPPTGAGALFLLAPSRAISPAAAGRIAGCARPISAAALAPTTFGLTSNHNVSFPFEFPGESRDCPLAITARLPKSCSSFQVCHAQPVQIGQPAPVKNPCLHRDSVKNHRE